GIEINAPILLVITECVLHVLVGYVADAIVHLSAFRKIVGILRIGRSNDRFGRWLERTGKDSVQGVVVGCGNGVELVVMTTCTSDGQAQESLGRDVDAIIDDVARLSIEVIAESEKTECGQ